MAGNVKRNIRERGVVLEKIFKPATDAWTKQTGERVEAQPDRYILKCVSGETFSQENGFEQSSVLEYKVEKELFDKVKAYTPVVVKYEISNYGAKADSVELESLVD